MLNIQKIEDKLFKVFVIVTGVALFTPLFLVTNILRPYILSKALSFQVLALVLAVIWGVLMAINWQKYKPKKNLLVILTTIFVGIVFLSSVFGLDFSRSFWGNAERIDGFLALFHFYIFFLALVSVLKNKPGIFRKLIFTFLITGFISTWYVILQKVGMIKMPMGGSFTRPEGLFGNPTFLSGHLLVNLFLGIWYYFTKGIKKIDWKMVSALVFIFFNIVGLVWTQTRGSWLGLIVAVLVFLIASIFTFSKRIKIISGAVLLLIIILGGLFIGFKDQIRYSSLAEKVPLVGRLSKALSPDDSSGLARLHSWGWALDWSMERPVLGVGQDMFYNVFDRNYDPNNARLMNERFDRAHNKFIDVLVMNGAIGLISYILLLGGICWVIIKKALASKSSREKTAWLAILSLIFAYSVHNFFVFDTPGNYLAFFFVLSWLTSISGNTDDSKGVSNSTTSSIKIGLVGALLILISIGIFYKVDYLPYKTARLSYQAETVNPPNIEATFQYYDTAISQDTFLNSEIRKMWAKHFLNFLIYTHQNSIVVDPAILRGLSDRFLVMIEEGILEESMIDFYIYPATIYAQLAWRPEDLSQADREYYYSQSEKWFSELKELWPGRVDYYIVWSEDNFVRGNYEKTEELLNDILEKTPDYGRAIWLRSALDIAGGNFSVGVSGIGRATINNVSNKWEESNIFNALIPRIPEDQKDNFLKTLDEEFNVIKIRDNATDFNILSFAILGQQFHSRLQSQDYEPWANYLEIYLSKTPNDADSWARLAALYGKLQSKDRAIFAATRAFEVAPAKYGPNYQAFVDLIQNEEWDKLP